MSDQGFADFPNIARQSIVEVASKLLAFKSIKASLIFPSEILTELVQLRKMTLAFCNTLRGIAPSH